MKINIIKGPPNELQRAFLAIREASPSSSGSEWRDAPLISRMAKCFRNFKKWRRVRAFDKAAVTILKHDSDLFHEKLLPISEEMWSDIQNSQDKEPL